METTGKKRPAQVTTAVFLIVIGYLAGLSRSLYAMATSKLQIDITPLFIVLVILLPAIMLLILWKILKGKNWARIFLLVCILLSLAGVFRAVGHFGADPLASSVRIGQTVLDFIVLYLLFTKPGSLWFKKGGEG